MSASAIEWTERTWNPVVGCSVHSAGCTNCYAMKMAGRLEAMAQTRVDAGLPAGPTAHYLGTTQRSKAGFVWTGKVNVAPDSVLMEPLTRKKPTTWFVNSMSDLFHESVPDEVIDRVFAVMALCPQHQFQVLTKRADRMRRYMAGFDDDLGGRIEGLRGALIEGMAQKIWHDRTGDDTVDEWLAVHLPLPNVWLGVSVEDQRAANDRIPHLLETPAAVRFLSCEPMLGAIDLTWIEFANDRGGTECYDVLDLHGLPEDSPGCRALVDWVIIGGESGPGAREFPIERGVSVVNQCLAAGVPVFVKQLGARPTLGGKRWNTDDRKGGDPEQWPAALRVRKMPGAAHV